MVLTFRLEDLACYLPEGEQHQNKGAIYSGIRKYQTPLFTEQSRNYNLKLLNDTTALQLEELSRNPAFGLVPLVNLDNRIQTGVLDKYSKEWQYGLSTVDIGLVEGYKTWFFSLAATQWAVEDGYKYLLMESFENTDDVDWAANGDQVTPVTSSGYDRQDTELVWIEISGTWVTSTTVEIEGVQSITCSSGAGVLVGGFDWWRNIQLECWVHFADDPATDFGGLIFGYTNLTANNNYYLFKNNSATTMSLNHVTGAAASASLQVVTIDQTLAADSWHHYRVVVQNNHIQCFINGTLAIDYWDVRFPAGRVGCYTSADHIYFDDYRVTLVPPVTYHLPADAMNYLPTQMTTVTTAHGVQSVIGTTTSNADFQLGAGYNDCVLDLPMNEGEGEILYDHSQYHHPTKIINATWTEDSEKGWCLATTATSSVQVIKSAAITGMLDSDERITIVCDFCLTSDTNGYIIYDYSYGFYIWYQAANNRLRFYTYGNLLGGGAGSGFDYYTADNSVSTDTWYRLVVMLSTASASSITQPCMLFLNNELLIMQHTTNTYLQNTSPHYIGHSGTASFIGKITNYHLYTGYRWDVVYNYHLTPATVFCWDTRQYEEAATYPTDEYLVLGLHMDEGAGTRCYDFSGKGHDGTVSPITVAPVWTTTSFRGDANTCLDFEATVGSQGFVVIPHHADFNFINGANVDVPFTLEAWIKLESHTIIADIISKYEDNTPACEWEFGHDANGYLFVRCYDKDNKAIYIGREYQTALTNSMQYYVAATYDGSEASAGIKLYVNGAEVTTVDDSAGAYAGMENCAENVLIGARYSSAAPGYHCLFDGLIDEVRVHKNYCMPAAEIAARYRSEPWLHDIYSCRRVYDTSHEWRGLPIISNGLIKVSLADYDCYERGDYSSNHLPLVYGWWSNAWHLIGALDFKVATDSSRTDTFVNDWKLGQWWLEELTDQRAVLHLRYTNGNAATNYSHYAAIDYRLIIQNGMPGVIIEEASENRYLQPPVEKLYTPYTATENGLFVNWALTEGFGGVRKRFEFCPDTTLYDAEVSTAADHAIASRDDNWQLYFGTNEDTAADMNNAIIGLWWDNIGYNGTYSFVDTTNDIWSGAYFYSGKVYGLFFVPYDVDLLHKDGYDLTAVAGATPTNVAGSPATATDGGTMFCTLATDDCYWTVGVLPKGLYWAYMRYSSTGASVSDFGAASAIVPTWLNYVTFDENSAGVYSSASVFFYANGTDTIYLYMNQAHDAANIYVDYMLCVPCTSNTNYPVNIRDQMMHSIDLRRGLRHA